MTIMVPRSKPQQSREETERIVRTENGITDICILLGVRGYYRDTMGKPGVNDRGLYDDAIFLLTPNVHDAWNANTDPTAHYRAGLAVLKPGLWRYKIGVHGLSKPAKQRYKALVQAAPATVIRDGKGPDTGLFGINIHKGSYSTTSSLGCQTIWPEQWRSFISLVESQMEFFDQETIPYLLINGPTR